MKDGGSAFPKPTEYRIDGTLTSYGSDGMTLRDYFAVQVIQGCVDSFWEGVEKRQHGSDERWRIGCATDAYLIADAMIQVREQTRKDEPTKTEKENTK